MSLFPGALPVAGTAVSSDTLAAAGHTALHNTSYDEIRAIATKMGTGASTPTSGTVLRGTGVGTSAWGQVALTTDVTETLPVANGGTGVNTVADFIENAYPVGSIYINASDSTNPATLLGFGTWSAFGAGRVMVGLDSGQTEFDTAEETGGAKTHTLTTAEMPAHDHDLTYRDTVTGAAGGATAAQWQVAAANNLGTLTDAVSNTGGGGAHNNLQPYIVVYMWKRTA